MLLERIAEQSKIDKVSIFNSPLLSLKVLSICIGKFFLSVITFGSDHLLEVALIVTGILSFLYLPIVQQSVSLLTC